MSIFKEYPTTIRDYDNWARFNDRAVAFNGGLYHGLRMDPDTHKPDHYSYKKTALISISKGKIAFMEMI